MRQRHFLNGIEINEPDNYEELEIELNFDKDGNNAAVSINTWEFGVGDVGSSTDGVIINNKHIADGLTGGVGVGEGIPYLIQLDDQKTKVFDLFSGYVDLWRATVDCDMIIAPAVEKGNIDWLNEVADSVSFEFLKEQGVITVNDYVPVPYVIEKKQNSIEIIMALVTIFVVADKINDQIQDLKQMAASSSNPFEATVIFRAIIKIAYIIILFVALVKLVKDLVNMLIPPVKYHQTMYWRTSLEKGLSHFGLTLSSSILQQPPYDKAVIMPEKFNINENNVGLFQRITGYLKPTKNEQDGFFKGTVGDCLALAQLTFNAKITIEGTTLFLEPDNTISTKPKFKFPPLDLQPHKFNPDDFFSNIHIRFQWDSQDRHTIQEYDGTEVQITTTPITINNKDMVLLSKLDSVSIGLALGKRKTELTFLEKIISAFLKAIQKIVNAFIAVVNLLIRAINAIIKLINAIIKALNFIGINVFFLILPIREIPQATFGDLIDNRIGMLKMENDFVNVAKILLVDNNTNARNNKLRPENESRLNARYLWDNYHYHKSFIAQQDNPGNQYIIRDFNNITFCFEDYEKVRNNNRIFDSDNKEGEIISLKFNPVDETASGSYKIRQIYTNNLQETIIEPDGK